MRPDPSTSPTPGTRPESPLGLWGASETRGDRSRGGSVELGAVSGATGAVPHPRIGVVELFAGAGGFSTGLRRAGYTGRALGLEWDLDACRTATTAGHERIRADVTTYPAQRFTGIEGILGSPPCRAFSKAVKGLVYIYLPRFH
ncbi:MAG: DNA cytosine methyltransferase [Pseudonocardiaceae bacterium]